MTDRSANYWYPTAAYLYVLHLDGPALAWEYLRRNPDYRRDWLRRRRRPDAAQAWGLRLLEDPALDARDAHPVWFPDHDAVVQLYPDADPPPDACAFEFWCVPGRKHLIHDGKRLVLVSHGRVAAYGSPLRRAWKTAWPTSTPPAPGPARAIARSRPSWMRYPPRQRPSLRQRPAPDPSLLRYWRCTPCKRSTRPWWVRPCVKWPKGCSVPMPSRPTGTRTAPCAPACGGWCGVARR